jgi:hypothetical protein
LPRADLAISHAQVCVFDPALATPFNDWSERHVQQGFSWRPGSVSFAVEPDCPQLHVAVYCSTSKPKLADASTAIRVPFEVPPAGEVEVASIADGFLVRITPGGYDLYFALRGQRVDLTFAERAHAEAQVIVSWHLASPQPSYLMEANPA